MYRFSPWLLLLLAACTDPTTGTRASALETFPQALFVAHEGSIASWDLATGEQRAGELQGVSSPVDLQALADGTLLVNLTGSDQILVFDGQTLLERARLPSSRGSGTRPVHGYVAPELGARKLWVALNDGDGTRLTNSAAFVDLDPASDGYLTVVGEVGLGIGHHKAAFSTTKPRLVISSIGDCDDALTVYDYADLSSIQPLLTINAADLGFDGSSRNTTCDPTYQAGMPPAPHGCATSTGNGKVYCNVTSTGELVAIDVDADPPTFSRIPSSGSGGGYTRAHPEGRYLFSLQKSPREVNDFGPPGPTCQIGQLVVLDSLTDTISAELPLLYDGAGCVRSLAGTAAASANPGHLQLHEESGSLLITSAGGFGVADARVDKELVVDVSDPAHPVQRASLTTGEGSGHVGDLHTGDHRFVLTANNVAGTVSQIDCDSLEVVKNLRTSPQPLTLATWGTVEGPSHQTGPHR